MRAVLLSYAKISQTESLELFANLAAFFAHVLTRFSCLLCTDPSTQPHIQESDPLLTCRINFRITVSLLENTHFELKCLSDFLYCIIYLISPA
jgi:hypothetical protein